MALENAREHLKKYDFEDRIMEFDVSSATVELAAKAVGTDEARIAKSMAYDIKGETVIVVLAGDARTDNRKFKETFKTKAKMLSPDETKERIGHEQGGICPFGIKEDVTVYLDESLKRFETVYPACGSDNSAIELTLPELERVSESKGWVEISKK